MQNMAAGGKLNNIGYYGNKYEGVNCIRKRLDHYKTNLFDDRNAQYIPMCPGIIDIAGCMLDIRFDASKLDLPDAHILVFS